MLGLPVVGLPVANLAVVGLAVVNEVELVEYQLLNDVWCLLVYLLGNEAVHTCRSMKYGVSVSRSRRSSGMFLATSRAP